MRGLAGAVCGAAGAEVSEHHARCKSQAGGLCLHDGGFLGGRWPVEGDRWREQAAIPPGPAGAVQLHLRPARGRSAALPTDEGDPPGQHAAGGLARRHAADPQLVRTARAAAGEGPGEHHPVAAEGKGCIWLREWRGHSGEKVLTTTAMPLDSLPSGQVP